VLHIAASKAVPHRGHRHHRGAAPAGSFGLYQTTARLGLAAENPDFRTGPPRRFSFGSVSEARLWRRLTLI
jgi:hypothetical protein